MSDVTYSDTCYRPTIAELAYHVGRLRRKNVESWTSMFDHGNRGAFCPCTPARSPAMRSTSHIRYVVPWDVGVEVKDEDCMTEGIDLQSLNTRPGTESCHSTAPDCRH